MGELTRQIKGSLERGFTRVMVRGEISGFRGANPRGHLYFSLKDVDACVDAKIWASTAQRLKFKLRDGLSVVAEGSIDVYEPQGRYSLIITRVEPEGVGALALAFQQLKDRLQEEGLFGERRKRPVRDIPFLPRRIGVVTSLSGAALSDFLRILHQRHPRLPVLICDSRMQGESAVREVVSALERLARTDVDVIVVTRGGGSMEDLWTFNEERVARAIHACPVPVVSAIGHEVDFTIADFVADLRAPTPSAAAERLAPVLRDLELGLAMSSRRLHKAAERRVLDARQRLMASRSRLADPRRLLGQKQMHLSEQAEQLGRLLRGQLRKLQERHRQLEAQLHRQRPQARLNAQRQRLARLSEQLQASLRERLRTDREQIARAQLSIARNSPRGEVQRQKRQVQALRTRLMMRQRELLSDHQRGYHRLLNRLEAMNPLKVMARGYSVTFRRADGRVVRSSADVQVGDELAIRFAPGSCATLAECEEVDARVTAVKPREGTAVQSDQAGLAPDEGLP